MSAFKLIIFYLDDTRDVFEEYEYQIEGDYFLVDIQHNNKICSLIIPLRNVKKIVEMENI